MHYFRWKEGISDRAYPELDEFFSDLARAYREELADLSARGATYVQLDDVAFAILCDPQRRAEAEGRGYDPDTLIDRYIDLTNDALDGRPEGVVVGMHLCRGNNQGKWLGEGGYDYVAERIFNRLDLDAFFLEYDSPRAGSFEPLRFMPADKHVVLGLVSSKVPTARIEGRAPASDRGGGELRLAREALSQPAVWLRERRGGQSGDTRRPAQQA